MDVEIDIRGDIVKSKTASFITALMLALLVCSCSNSGTPSQPTQSQQEPAKGSPAEAASKPESLELQVSELKDRIDALEGNLASANQSLGQLNQSLGQLQSDLNSRGMATFDPIATQGYAPVDTGIVRLMVRVKDITPFADGVKVTLQIGNPNAVTLDGLTGTAYYGPSWESAKKDGTKSGSKTWAGDWLANQQHTALQISETLLPGRWTPAVVILPSIKGSDFGRLVLELKADKVAMYGG